MVISDRMMSPYSPEHGRVNTVYVYSLRTLVTLSHPARGFTAPDTVGHTSSLRLALPAIPVTRRYARHHRLREQLLAY